MRLAASATARRRAEPSRNDRLPLGLSTRQNFSGFVVGSFLAPKEGAF